MLEEKTESNQKKSMGDPFEPTDEDRVPPEIIATSDDSCGSETDFEQESDTDESSAYVTTKALESPPCAAKQCVQFSNVEVREYAVQIGDHPLTQMYPLSLDWAFASFTLNSVDHYESSRRRPPQALARKLTVEERMSRLVNVTGHTARDLFALERKRQLLAQEEKRLAALGIAR